MKKLVSAAVLIVISLGVLLTGVYCVSEASSEPFKSGWFGAAFVVFMAVFAVVAWVVTSVVIERLRAIMGGTHE